VAGIRGGAGVALPWWGGSPKMLLQTVPVTRFKAGAVGSEMRQGNKTKRPTGTPICEQSQQPGSGRPWSGRYKGPIFFQQEQPTFHASTHNTLVVSQRVPLGFRAMIGTKPKCQLQREDFGWARHCKPPCCREGAAEDLIRVQISAYRAVLGDLHSTPAITSFACRTISDRRQLTSSRTFKSACCFRALSRVFREL
jgi:hypothetical protein